MENIQNEVKKEVDTQNKEKAIEPELLNKIINYTIIRNLWFVSKGIIASADENKNLYRYVSMSKTRYDRICSGGSATISKALIEKVKKDIAIEEKVMTGGIRLSLEIQNSSSSLILNERLVKYAENRTLGPEKITPDITEKNKKILDDLKKHLRLYVASKDAIEKFCDYNMKRLAYFVKYEYSYQEKAKDSISSLIASMQNLTFDKLEKINSKVLGAYSKELKEQSGKVNVILAYRKASRVQK